LPRVCFTITLMRGRLFRSADRVLWLSASKMD
jgi:hypothetical protein